MEKLSQHAERLQQNLRAAYLIHGFIQKDLTMEEEEELDNWILASDDNMKVFEDLTEDDTIEDFLRWYQQCNTEENLQAVKKRMHFKKPSRIVSFWRYAAAACILAIAGTGMYYFVYKRKSQPPPVIVQQDIAPGKLTARLTLSDGRVINLQGQRDTVISAQIQIRDGQIVYTAVSGEAGYHEVNIPRKGSYQLLLPDGTKVWLNAESSIRYPATFSGNERRVTVTGETYFEVAKDAAHPFIVSVGSTEVTALGTVFNLNAYPNEPDFTATLVEGSIKVKSGNRQVILQPRQQLLAGPSQWRTKDIDTGPVTAWVSNHFKLKNNSIEEVMRMVERWYDADIVYTGKVTDHFTGGIDRDVPVSQLLKILEATGEVHFSIEGRTITVNK